MKNHQSKYTLVLAILLSITYPLITKAQIPFSYGVKAGLNLSSSSYNRYFTDRKSLKPGFRIGFTGEYGFTKSLFVQSEIAFTTRGVIYRGTEIWVGGSKPPVTHWKNTFSQTYLQIPLKLAYKCDISSKIRLLINAGGYAAYGISAIDKTKNRYTGVEMEDDEKSHNLYKGKSLKKYDMGIITGIGAEYGPLTFAVNYEYGLKDIGIRMPDSAHDFEYHNRNISFTMGYRFR
jgi:hypothetical protein